MSEIAKHWIDGEWVGSGTVSESINPAMGAVLSRWTDGGDTETRAAIAAARRAFDTASWSPHLTSRSPATPAAPPSGAWSPPTAPQPSSDSYATAASFRKDGFWTVQTEPGLEPFPV